MSERRDARGEHSVNLPERTIATLEELRRLSHRESISEVLEEAVTVWARLHGPAERNALALLTPRLREVLTLIAEGLSTKEIAARLQISVKTAEFHRARLMTRLQVRGTAGLVRWAIRVGLVLP